MPKEIAPHPKNRGGEAVKSCRTKELNGLINKQGFDSDEASFKAIVIEAKPVVTGQKTWFQMAFEESVAADPDMAVSQDDVVALFGSVSKSHSNCGKRNILAGKKGCMCDQRQLAVAGCKCDASSILDEHGNYCLHRLKESDPDWYQGLFGMEYEVLSWKIDDEVSDGAQKLALANNLILETGMKRSHLEIWSAMERLCTPDPTSGHIRWEPVRDKLEEMYGPAAEDVELLDMFKFQVGAGAKGSKHLADMSDFMVVYVNPKHRKMPYSAYATMA